MPSDAAAFATTDLLIDLFGGLPFRGRDAQLRGVPRKRLDAAATIGLLGRISRDVYVVKQLTDGGDDDQLHERALAIQLAIPGAVISHESAARLHGLDFRRRWRRRHEGDLVTATVPGGSHLARDGYRTVSARVPQQQRVTIDGIVTTGPARTAVDLARQSNLGDGLAVCDSAMRKLVLRAALTMKLDDRVAVHRDDLRTRARESLELVARDMPRWPGIRPARRAILEADPASESPLESASRAVAITAGLPAPKVGWPITLPNGRTVWGDLVWLEERVVGEADGALKYTSRDDLMREKLREDALRSCGWTVVRWTWNEAVVEPHLLVRKLHRVL